MRRKMESIAVITILVVVFVVLLASFFAILMCWGVEGAQRHEPWLPGISWLEWLRCSY